MNFESRPSKIEMTIFNEKTAEQFVPNGDIISAEAIVNMLVRKGICTAEELFMLEGQIREKNKETKESKVIAIKSEYNRGRFPWLKRWMSKRRWTRRLGTALFGWKWKKVKKSTSL